jgi:hypothetical protein
MYKCETPSRKESCKVQYCTNTGFAGSHSKSERFLRRRKGEHKRAADGGRRGKRARAACRIVSVREKKAPPKTNLCPAGLGDGVLFFPSVPFPFIAWSLCVGVEVATGLGGGAGTPRPREYGRKKLEMGGVVPARRELLSFARRM